MYFFKNTSGNWILGHTPDNIISKEPSRLLIHTGTNISVVTVGEGTVLIPPMEITGIKKNANGEFYSTFNEFKSSVSDFFDNVPITAEEVDAKIGAEVDTLSERIDTVENIANASTGGSLGSIKPTDAAPTPARNGNYTFSIGGNKPAWLTAEAGVTTVKAGDGVAVVFTAPNTYSYTHVNVSSDFALKTTIQKMVTYDIGANLATLSYVPKTELGEVGGINTVITTNGAIVSATNWFTSSRYLWGSNTNVSGLKIRSFVQYNSSGAIITASVYYPASEQSNVTIAKHVDAVSFAFSYSVSTPKNMVNFGGAVLPYTPYVIKSIVESDETLVTRLKRMLIGEQYIPVNPTYDDNGIVVSPLSVVWSDSATGALIITRNSDLFVTNIIATHILNALTTTITMQITRDSDNRVSSVTITL